MDRIESVWTRSRNLNSKRSFSSTCYPLALVVERDNFCFGACGSQPYPCSYLSWIPRIDRERRHAWSHDFMRENQRYINRFVYISNARLWVGGKVVIFHWSKCWRRVNNRLKMNPLDTGYGPSVTRSTDIVSTWYNESFYSIRYVFVRDKRHNIHPVSQFTFVFYVVPLLDRRVLQKFSQTWPTITFLSAITFSSFLFARVTLGGCKIRRILASSAVFRLHRGRVLYTPRPRGLVAILTEQFYGYRYF